MMSSRDDRERLKEEYKQHYRKMRDTKERFRQGRQKQNIVQALKNMDAGELMESFDAFLFEVKSKVAKAEARLDVALDSLEEEDGKGFDEGEADEIIQNHKAKQTLKQLKNEMGLLYRELEEQADAIQVEKTVGSKPNQPPTKGEKDG